ncbi:DUF4280 domain-containing protein [Christensenellaceae bacterium OttesenSCG-928-M15]|nr:DUF4280 domain-containing protein [Christensenellaceae bacterium OttesenSCG-928-M15]
MAFPLTLGFQCQCSFGVAPSSLPMTKQQQALAGNRPLATIMDNTLPPFGVCSSLANPTVAAATAAALGVLTPQPCTPVIPAPWAPGAPTVLIGGKPVLNNSSKLMCAYGGVIQVLAPTVTNVQVP